MGDDPNQQGNSRRWLIREVEASLRRLQTDDIDLYLVHRPSPDTDIEETLSALTDLLRAGKVRAIGSSTFPASEIVEAQWVAERRGLARFRVEQPSYSILSRGIEREVLPVCQPPDNNLAHVDLAARKALKGLLHCIGVPSHAT
jgi:aryl-alcohol dehydrogenase-like predicted oxidoreductase